MGPLISQSDRYIGRQVLFATIFGVIVLSLIFVLGNLFKQIFELLVDRNLPVNAVLQFILYILPYSLIFTIPWSVLIGVLLVFGRLSADNELLALRLSGMSMFRLCRPVFFIAGCLVCLSFLINTKIAPRGKAAMKETLYNMAIDDPLALIVPDKVIYQFPNYRIYAESRIGNKLLGLEVIELDENKVPIRYIRAMEAGVEYDESEDQLLLLLDNAEGVIKNEKDPADFDNLLPGISAEKTTIPLDLSSFRNNP
ncbi:MAG: LptF/LptG family permease, partial [Verrucomicrobiales bacterium]